MKHKIAVVLSGCGVYDGAEIFESVLSLLFIEEQGASYQAFAPNIQQHHVINHLTGEEMPEARNVLVEASRIVRGKIKDISEAKAEDFDALIIPGGFGVAKNLSDFAFNGSQMQVQTEVLKLCKAFHQAKKPIGFACIAPALDTAINPDITLTIGSDPETAKALENMGAQHIDCEVNEAYIDEDNLIVSTPACMLSESVSGIAPGIELLIKSVVSLMSDN